jgi:dephospho-CoA kinase
MLNQNRPLLIGITGGIGSGKSTVCRVFNCLGVPIYNADSRARWLMNNNDELIQKIKNEFGQLSYKNGLLDRTYLAQLVFSNLEKLAKLNSLTHPAVAIDFENWVKLHYKAPYLIKEAALLIESGAYNQLDELILVSAPTETRIKRVLNRDSQRSKSQIKDIIEKQLPETEMAKHAKTILNNNGLEPILSHLLRLHLEFSKK